MVKLYIDEINRVLDTSNHLSSNNDLLRQTLNALNSFSDEENLSGQAWGSAKSVAVDAYIPLVQGLIAYNEAVITGNKKVKSAVSSFHYGTPLDEQDLLNALSGYTQSLQSYKEILQDLSHNEMKNPLMMPHYEVIKYELQGQINTLNAAIKEINSQIRALHEFVTRVQGAYDESQSIKGQLEYGFSALGTGGSNTYSSGHFTITSMSDWALSLTETYNQKKYNRILSTLDTTGMEKSEIKAYRAKVEKELVFLDSSGWDEKGQKNYIRYLNEEYKHFEKDHFLHLTAEDQWLSPNGAGDLLINGLHNFFLNIENYQCIKTSFKSANGTPKMDLSGKSEWTILTDSGNSFNPAFMSYFGDDIPHLKVEKKTYELRSLTSSGQNFDPNSPYVYYLFSNGKFDSQATKNFFDSGSRVHSDYLINSAVEQFGDQIKMGIVEFALFAAATPIDPEIVIGEELVEDAGAGVFAKTDDLGKLSAGYRGVQVERLNQIVDNISASETRLSKSQIHALLEASDNNITSKTTLLGGWRPNDISYEQLANKAGYNYYDMGSAYDKLEGKIPKAGQDINEAWLDEKINAGNDFVLSTDPYSPTLGDSYLLELRKLRNAGYNIPNTPSTDGLWVITKGK